MILFAASLIISVGLYLAQYKQQLDPIASPSLHCLESRKFLRSPEQNQSGWSCTEGFSVRNFKLHCSIKIFQELRSKWIGFVCHFQMQFAISFGCTEFCWMINESYSCIDEQPNQMPRFKVLYDFICVKKYWVFLQQIASELLSNIKRGRLRRISKDF